MLKMLADCYKFSEILGNAQVLSKCIHAGVAVIKVKKEKATVYKQFC